MTKFFNLAGALSLPQTSLGALTESPAPAIWLEPTSPRRTFLRRAPFAHHDPDQAKVFSDLLPVEINYPPSFVMSLPDTQLIGFRSFLYEDLFYIDDPLANEADVRRHVQRLDHDDEHRNERTGFRTAPNSSGFSLRETAKKEIRLDEPVCVISSDEPENYGSFIFRVLPKLIAYRYMGLDHRIITPAGFESMRRLLEICGIKGSQLIAHDTTATYHLSQAIVPSVRNPHAFLDEVSLSLIDEIRESVSQASPSSDGRLIYVSRENLGSTKNGYRAMTNAAELRDALQKLGFQTIYPEIMTADQQVRAFASASVIVGQSGGAMFNAAFCRPGSIIIDIESEPHWIHAHMSYFSSLNLRYIIFEAKPIEQADRTIHLPFRVNVTALVDVLNDILSARLDKIRAT